ncbi:helix-turn-helix transcriptional regulator [Devosia alba]|uniref:helix-turn-helix transcriptional regulator n=1 Tax=Devosia alba TaxID=3152360 RepID=UPI003264C48D
MDQKDHRVTGRQIAAARALSGISQSELASLAKISIPTLKRMEASPGVASGMANNVAAVRSALEAAGVAFLDEGDKVDGGPGVRLHRKPIDNGYIDVDDNRN